MDGTEMKISAIGLAMGRMEVVIVAGFADLAEPSEYPRLTYWPQHWTHRELGIFVRKRYRDFPLGVLAQKEIERRREARKDAWMRKSIVLEL
jgi:hypothetical protein